VLPEMMQREEKFTLSLYSLQYLASFPASVYQSSRKGEFHSLVNMIRLDYIKILKQFQSFFSSFSKKQGK